MTAGARSVGGDRMAAICQGIRRAIIEGALMPGDRLPEDALGESFGVSRTIARHALGQLAAEGLVDLRRNRIATVTAPTNRITPTALPNPMFRRVSPKVYR